MIPIITGFLSKINKKIIIAVIMVLIVSIFIVLIAAKDSEIHKKEKEIAQYQEDIKGLELQAQTLQNEILFIKENEKFQNSFSNSSVMIDNLFKTKIRPADDKSSAPYREDLSIITKEENETFNSISNNFYKYFNDISFCSTKIKYVKVPLSKPPEIFIIKSVTNRQDLMRRYQESIIKIGEWQLWYNIQAGTNYYLYKK
ncbi:hypothetical protein OFQ52_09595 [Brachyspira hyodysenteriae]|nr:hypothetical protein [Brachyspira hyodysenteriae]MCZ9931027.1 hypothetical protein [Brachyspira hyodysenteriae]MDA0053096.1 hypothetical protein [Brachyspira hyodysenteriae]MDA0074906.1 hypothetical protein [Brachyspira hyodysenteriae]